MNVDKFIRETLANKIEEAVAEIRKTILHPDNEPNVTLYPKTSIDQVEQLTEQLNYIKTNLIKDTIIGTDGIVIYKAADSEKIKISGSELLLKPANAAKEGYYNLKAVDSLGNQQDVLLSNALDSVGAVYRPKGGRIFGYCDDTVSYDTPYTLTNKKYVNDHYANKKYVDDAIENITLYRHDLHIMRTANSSVPGFGYSVYCSFYSSSNLNISSVSNLRTVLGNAFTVMATGYLSGTNANYDPVEAIFQSGVIPIRNTTQTYDNATFNDNVTKII